MRVVLRRRSREPGRDFDEEEAVWPRGWPLPEPGSIVIGSEAFGSGLTRHVEFDLRGARIVVLLV